jgi:WXG100 family type VII secretion target
MAEQTRMDDATVHQAANDCRSAVDTTNEEVRKIRAARERVAARWQGAASNAFQGVMDAWVVEAGKLMEAMGGIADLLDKTGSTHRANEEDQNQMFNKFNSAINR